MQTRIALVHVLAGLLALCGVGGPLGADPVRASSETVVHSFGATPSDSYGPQSPLLIDGGTIFGTSGGGERDQGTVYKLLPSGAERIIHDFGVKATDEVAPLSGLTRLGALFYGVTAGGGAFGQGTVYVATKVGARRVLYSFTGGSDGSFPRGELIAVKGVLYGATLFGGSSPLCKCGSGTIFSIDRTGHEQIVYRFQGIADGAGPIGPLLDVNGTLYGVTLEGGCVSPSSCGGGTVFSLTLDGTLTVLHTFPTADLSDGYEPNGGLVARDGVLYGTTYAGGANYAGTVFSITPRGRETVVHSFQGGDGAHPFAGLTAFGADLYGTTAEGGRSTIECIDHTIYGCGTVFKIDPEGLIKTVHYFLGADGQDPSARLTASDGRLFGTTVIGGMYNAGLVFSLTP